METTSDREASPQGAGWSSRDGYDPSYFDPLFAVEDRHFWFRARNHVVAALANRVAAGLAPGFRALEIGTGTGNTLRVLDGAFAGATVVGMDLYLDGLRYARGRTDCFLVQGDLFDPPFRERFHVIGLFDVLEHIPNDVEVLNRLRSMLVPEGALLLTVPARRSLWSYFDEASSHFRRYELGELVDKLNSAKLRVELATEYMAILFPLMWVGRRLASRSKVDSGKSALSAHDLALKELRIAPGINEILASVLLVEARLIRAGARLPFGTSIAVIARRS